jgi:hypothetical protein
MPSLFVSIFPFRPRERQIANLGSIGVFDFDDRLVRALLNDASGTKQPATLATDADLVFDDIITRRNKEHPVRIRVQCRLDRRVGGDRQFSGGGADGEETGEKEKRSFHGAGTG